MTHYCKWTWQKKINSYTMHNEILLSFIKKHLATNSPSLSQKHSSQSDFILKTVFISVSPCYQHYTLSHFHQISNLYRDSWNKRKRSIKMIPRIYFGILFSLLLHLTKAEERIFDQITWIEKKLLKLNIGFSVKSFLRKFSWKLISRKN